MPNPEFQHFKDGNVTYDVSDAEARSHIASLITGVSGIHDIRYYDGTLAYYDRTLDTPDWVEIETGSGGIIELTADEFSHLTEEEKNENVIYIITDGLDAGTGQLTGIFTGTHQAWNLLTDAEKAVYSLVFFTDDYETASQVFTGATSQDNGTIGLVPQPLVADKDKYLKGDGTWGTPTDADTKYDGSNLNTKVAQTGTAQSSISSSVAANIPVDSVVGTLLDNDKTLDTSLGTLNTALMKEATARAEVGAHNLLKPFSFEEAENDGITFTSYGDGTYKLNGTATAMPSGYNVVRSTQLSDIGSIEMDKEYILTSGRPDSVAGYGVTILLYNGNTLVHDIDARNGDATFKLSDYTFDTIVVSLSVIFNKTVNNKIIKPMILSTSDSDRTFQPFTMTNKELTNNKVNKSDITNNLTTTASGKALDARQGKVLNDALSNQKVLVITTGSFSSLPQTYTSSNNSDISNVTANHVVIKSILSNPYAQVGEWTITTAANSITIAGSIVNSTNLTLYLALKR